MRRHKIATYRTRRGAERYAARCAARHGHEHWEFRIVPEPQGFGHCVGAFRYGVFRAYVATGLTVKEGV
jgi:hypothetical protein